MDSNKFNSYNTASFKIILYKVAVIFVAPLKKGRAALAALPH
jgi:hypothetical protein